MMKKIRIITAGAAAIMATAAITGCSASNDLQRATRGNGAYDYNYDYSGGDTTGWDSFGWNNGNGAGYWDYYGITNGSANDTMDYGYDTGVTGRYGRPNTATDSTATRRNVNALGNGNFGASSVYGTTANDTMETSKVKVDAATVAN